MKKVKVTSRISDPAAVWYTANFNSLTGGITYVTDAFPILAKRTLSQMKGKFTRGELYLLIDTFNATMLTPEFSGQHIEHSAEDAIALDNLDQKWEVEKENFLATLEALSFFEKACLEIWVRAFWEGKRKGQEEVIRDDLEEYVAQLL